MTNTDSGKARQRIFNRLKKYHPERKMKRIGSRSSTGCKDETGWHAIVLCTEKYTCELWYTPAEFKQLTDDDLRNDIFEAALPQYEEA